jgi:hypothetical protein
VKHYASARPRGKEKEEKKKKKCKTRSAPSSSSPPLLPPPPPSPVNDPPYFAVDRLGGSHATADKRTTISNAWSAERKSKRRKKKKGTIKITYFVCSMQCTRDANNLAFSFLRPRARITYYVQIETAVSIQGRVACVSCPKGRSIRIHTAVHAYGSRTFNHAKKRSTAYRRTSLFVIRACVRGRLQKIYSACARGYVGRNVVLIEL